MRIGLAVVAASSGLTLPLVLFAFLWMWYVGVIVLTFSPRRPVRARHIGRVPSGRGRQ